MTTEPNTPKKPRRRFQQYSLWTLLVALTVFGVWLGVVVHQANEQRKVVAWVREMGGSVEYDYQFDEDGFRIDDAKPSGPKWLAPLMGIDCFQEVSRVNLHNMQVSDVTPLAGLIHLEQLALSGSQFSDLTPLAELKNLEWLELDGTQVSDLTHLAKLTRLEMLDLTNTQVRDLTPLAKLTSLDTLWLNSTQVRDLTPLAELKNLEWLSLANSQVRDLTPLANLTRLRRFHLKDTPVSEWQVEELRQALPNCEIDWSQTPRPMMGVGDLGGGFF